MRAPAKLPHRRTTPPFTSRTAVATTSASVVARFDSVKTSSSRVVFCAIVLPSSFRAPFVGRLALQGVRRRRTPCRRTPYRVQKSQRGVGCREIVGPWSLVLQPETRDQRPETRD